MQSYNPKIAYEVTAIATMPEQSIMLVEPPKHWYTVNIVIHDREFGDYDTFCKVYAIDEQDCIEQCKNAYRKAYGRKPYYEAYSVYQHK